MRYPIRVYQTGQSSSRRPLCVQHIASTRQTGKHQPNQLHLTGQYISELYFKSLNILEHGVEFKINGKQSHNFAQIYLDLKDPTKQELRQKFTMAVSKMNPSEIPNLERLIGGVVPKDLRTNLVEWSKVFTDLRYANSFIEKYKGKKVAMAFYPQMASSIRDVIIDREPTWKS